jgi:hypothetical protein
LDSWCDGFDRSEKKNRESSGDCSGEKIRLWTCVVISTQYFWCNSVFCLVPFCDMLADANHMN